MSAMLGAKADVPGRWLARPTVIVVAHPDDEIIGLATLLPQLQRLKAIVHVTDGAPRNGFDAQKAGCRHWLDYAHLRRGELEAALTKTGLRAVRQICLWRPDQQASFGIARNAIRLASLFESLRPVSVFTHTYEGGHPDHDACVAAVHAAVCLLKGRRRPAPSILEFASYHLGSDGMESECFLKNSGPPAFQHALSDAERRSKLLLFSCFASQQDVLSQFPCRNEPVRVAPAYNFAKPPHTGKLFYEQFDWGVSGRQWRGLARQAHAKLGIGSER